jgi:hypothetical protein
MSLVLLGEVVVGVLLEVAELAGGLDPLRHLGSCRTLQLLDLRAQVGDSLCRDRLAGELGIARLGVLAVIVHATHPGRYGRGPRISGS